MDYFFSGILKMLLQTCPFAAINTDNVLFAFRNLFLNFS